MTARVRVFLVVAAFVIVCVAADASLEATSTRDAAAVTAASSAANSIVAENAQPGTTAWQIGLAPYRVADDPTGQIKGYASATSVDRGGTIGFNVSVNPAQQYTIDIYRLGCYADASGTCLGGRFMQHLGPFDGVTQPACTVDGPSGTNTGLTECHWTGPTFTVPDTWTSGIYVGVLTNAANYQNYIQFVVRDDASHSAFLYQQPVATYEAYNNWPNYGGANTNNGKSLYDNVSGGADTVAGAGRTRAVKVSFDRPYAGPGSADLLDSNGWSWEGYFIRWAEKNGYDVTYSTSVDLQEHPQLLLNHKAFLSVGHDEYWSKGMFDGAEAARDAGVDLGFFGANDVYWQVRYEPSSTGVADRVIVSYKNTPNNTYLTNDPVSDPSLTTVRWQDPPVNRPGQLLTGVTLIGSTGRSTLNTPYQVENSGAWIYDGTGFTDGSSVAGIVGYEADKYSCMFPQPQNTSFTVLGSSPFDNAEDGYYDDSNSVLYRAPSGAWVFSTGTMSWTWALDRDGWVDQRIQQATRNILDGFSDVKATPPVPSSYPPCAEHDLMTFESGSLVSQQPPAPQDGAQRALGSLTLETASPIKGSYSARLANVGNSYLDQHITAVDDLDVTFSVRLNALPAADARIALTYSQVAPLGNLVLRSSGLLCVRNGNAWITGSATTSCTTSPLAAGTTYRIRLHQIRGTGTDGVFEGYLAAGDAPFGAPFARAATGTSTMRVDRVSVGSTTSVTLDAVFDDVAIDGGPVQAPAAPSGLAATSPTSSEVDLSWLDNASTESSFVVQRSTSSAFDTFTSFTAPANATSYADRSAAAATTYYYRVKASNAVGDSTYSNTASATTAAPPPAAPTGLASTVLSPTSTRLDWADNSSTESSFVVERSGDPSFRSPTSIVLPANTVAYTDAGLPDGAYYYRVKAVNTDGSASGYSNIARGPRIKNITFEDGAANLISTATGASSNAGGQVVLETASPIKGAYAARVPNIGNAYLEQTFAGVDELYASFYVRLKALPTADYRIAQVLDSGTTVANMWVRASGTLCLKWGNNWSGGSSSAGCTPTSTPLAAGSTYRVAVHQRRGDGSGNALVEAFFAQGDNPFPQDGSGNAVPFTSQSVPPADPGYWQTQATSFRFGGTLSTTPLDAVFDDVDLDSTFLPSLPPVPPAAPSGLAATSPRLSEVDLGWVDNAGNESSYVLQRSTSSSFDTVTSFSLAANTTTYADTSVAQATTYYYRVRAANAAGDSAYSNTATVTTGSPPPQPAAAPTNLVATPLSPTSTRLDWTDNSSTEAGFALERSRDASFATVTTVTLPANTVTYTDTGLADGTYFYRVKATTSDGTSSSYTNVVRGPRIKNVTFEDGTPNLVNSVSGASSNSGGLVVQESASPLKGTYSARVPNVANAYLEQSVAGIDDLYVSFYVRANALPTVDDRVAQVLASGTTVANLWLRASGTLCLKWGNSWSGGSAGTACTPSTKPLVPGTVYRVGVHQRRGDGTGNALVEAFFAQGDAAFPQDANGKPVPFTSQAVTPATTGYWQTQATAFRFGATLSTTALDAVFDDVKLDSAFLPSPS
ncbi:MAG: N,N-dimethylformamidase beta subunit family domain-containing protein [Gaiellaceae bacterium]